MIKEYGERRKALGQQLDQGQAVLLFAGNSPRSTADSVYKYRTNKSFYYMTGLKREGFILVLYRPSHSTIKDSPVEALLFIEEPKYDIEKWVGRKLTKEQVEEISGIQNVKYLTEFEPWLATQLFNWEIKDVFLDLDRIHWDDESSMVETFAKGLKKKYPQLRIGSISEEIALMRMVKSDHELDMMQKAIDITDEGLRALYRYAKSGVYEYELEAEFACKIRQRGADKISFETIVASGENGVILHYVENEKKIEDGQLVLLDLGAQYKEYAADISRTFPVNGTFTERQKEYYELVLKAQEDVLKEIKPGSTFAKLNEVCKHSIAQSLMKMGKIEKEEEVTNYFYHGVSHHLGLDVHDVGSRTKEFLPGMVITLEPGIYVADENIGIRIEDDVLVTKDGHRVLSEALPKSVEEIEHLLKK